MYVSTLLLSSEIPEEGIRSHYRCEPPCGCWELNLGPLEEQLVVFPAFVLSFETIFLCVVLAGLKTRLASNSGIRLPLPAQHWVEDMEQLSA